jgi:hypothetical protein
VGLIVLTIIVGAKLAREKPDVAIHLMAGALPVELVMLGTW